MTYVSSDRDGRDPPMRIAHIGQKGIPGHSGGVEAHVDEIARRLSRRSHDVTAYVRAWYTPRHVTLHEGVRLVHAPTIRTKHLDASLYTLASSIHSLTEHFDIVHYHGIGPSAFSWMPRLGGSRVVATVHARDWQRPKWGPAARACLMAAERCAVRFPDCTIAVSQTLRRTLEDQFGRPVRYIPNGVSIPSLLPANAIGTRFGLKGWDYVLYLGRLVPEKRVDWLIRAFRRTASRQRLVIAGGDDGISGYERKLTEMTAGDERVLFTGPVSGPLKAELLSNARCCVLPSSIEGLPIALLEAMSYGQCCLVSDIASHTEIVEAGRNGVTFPWSDFDAFGAALARLLVEPDAFVRAVGSAAARHVETHYGWDAIVDAIDGVYKSLRPRRTGGR
jgi:glycosyltransferase involved in cell wall biosynthesis